MMKKEAEKRARARFILLLWCCPGCRGCALTRWHLSDCACAVRQMHILPRPVRACERMPGADKPARARQGVLAGFGAQP